MFTLAGGKRAHIEHLESQDSVHQCFDSFSPSSPPLPGNPAINNSTTPSCRNGELAISGDSSLPLICLIHLIKESLHGPLRIMPLTFWAGITDWQPTDGIQLADNFVWPTQCLKDRNISYKNPSFQLLKKKSDIWQSSIAIFLHGKNWLDRAMAVLLRWECHLLPPSLLPTALHSAPFRLCGSPAPGFRGATGYHLHHLSLSPRYSLSSRSFLYFMFGVYGCVPFFFFSSFSLKVDFLLCFLLFELFGVISVCYSFYYLVYVVRGGGKE